MGIKCQLVHVLLLLGWAGLPSDKYLFYRYLRWSNYALNLSAGSKLVFRSSPKQNHPDSAMRFQHHHQQNHHHDNLEPPTSSPYMFSSMEDGLEDEESYVISSPHRRVSSERRHSADRRRPRGSNRHDRPVSHHFEGVYIKSGVEEPYMMSTPIPGRDKENQRDSDGFVKPVGVPLKTPVRKRSKSDAKEKTLQKEKGSVVKQPVVPTLSLPPVVTPSRSMDGDLNRLTVGGRNGAYDIKK